VTASRLRGGACRVGVVLAAALAWQPPSTYAEEPVLKLRATPAVAGSAGAPLSIELARWSSDTERPPLLAALSAPFATPTPAAAPAGRGAVRGGRGGRGGREVGPPPSPVARFNAAVKGAPTIGYIWGDGPTGYAIKYAWHSTEGAGRERIVLATERQLGSHALPVAEPSGGLADAEFTVVELRLDANGRGEGKTSLASAVVVDRTAATLALDAYAEAPVQLRITR
jgi:hypothetical protein